MNLICQLDRVAAFRGGINYSHSSNVVVIEVDPTTLPEADRQLLAGRMNAAGHVCARDEKGEFYNRRNSYRCSLPPDENAPDQVRLVMVVAPTLEALLAAVRAEEAAIVQAEEQRKAQAAEEARQQHEATLEVLNTHRTATQVAQAYAWRDGEQVRSCLGQIGWLGQPYQTAAVEYPVIDWPYRRDESVVASPEAQAWTANLEKVKAEAYEKAKAEAVRKLLAKEEADAKALAEETTWIKTYGSARLNRMLAEGIAYHGVYRDERLAKERPGWLWQEDVLGEPDAVLNPTEAAFALLDEVRRSVPEAKLAFWTMDEDQKDEDARTRAFYQAYVAVARFMDEDIVYKKTVQR